VVITPLNPFTHSEFLKRFSIGYVEHRVSFIFIHRIVFHLNVVFKVNVTIPDQI